MAPSCRDKGRMRGWVGALCLSSWQRNSVGFRKANMVHLQRGQAQGPLIHPTPPLVPTGRGLRNSLRFRKADMVHLQRGQAQGPLIHPTPPLVPTGRGGRKRPDGTITPFGRQNSSGRGQRSLPHSVVKIHQTHRNFSTGALAARTALCVSPGRRAFPPERRVSATRRPSPL